MQDLRSQLNQSLYRYAQKSAEELKNWLALWHDLGSDQTEARKSVGQKLEAARRLADEISILKNN